MYRMISTLLAGLLLGGLLVAPASPHSSEAPNDADPDLSRSLVGEAASLDYSQTGSAVFTNPLGAEEIPNFADPSVIRGRDGYWYAYGTGDPLFAGDEYRRMKIARSADLQEWEYVDDVFTAETEPRYDPHGEDANRMYWAPSVQYFDGRYVMYYSYVVNPGDGDDWTAIGAAEAPSPAGPWTDTGSYVTGPETWEPRPGVEESRNVIDPKVISTPEGTRYLYYGSVFGGIAVVELSGNGLEAVGEPVQITREHRYEAAHPIYRDGYYYLFLTAIGGCCAGPASAYPVHVGRAETPTGPFLDRDGNSVSDSHAGGTPVLNMNGNQWVGVGHTTHATDMAGQQWLITHGIDRDAPYTQGRLNARQLVMSRLDWIDGWPTANGGRGLLDGPQPAPAADAVIADSFERDDLSDDSWQPGQDWQIEEGSSGGHLQSPEEGGSHMLYAEETPSGDTRARGHVRFDDRPRGVAGLQLFEQDEGSHVRVVIDADSREFVVEVHSAGEMVDRESRSLPSNVREDDWLELDLHARNGSLEATVSHAGLGDPIAVAGASLPEGLDTGRFALVSEDAGASFDDITVAELYEPESSEAPEPELGDLDAVMSDEFTNGLDPRWAEVRDPEVTVEDGRLTLPVQEEELINQRPVDDNGAALLLRDVPESAWTVETRVTVPYGESYPHGWPQAGLIAHVDDDEFINLTYASAPGRTRHVTFGKEMPWEDDVLYGDARLGPTAPDTMWLRLKHQLDSDTGEHHYRAATSVDGESWVWHGVRTLPAGSEPRIGLAAFGVQQDDSLTAQFDYVRFYGTDTDAEPPDETDPPDEPVDPSPTEGPSSSSPPVTDPSDEESRDEKSSETGKPEESHGASGEAKTDRGPSGMLPSTGVSGVLVVAVGAALLLMVGWLLVRRGFGARGWE